MNPIQQHYDQAFEFWENKETEKAIEQIDKALELAPEDLALHMLAFHIKRMDLSKFSFVPHIEFIIDHDIHYKDTLDKHGEHHDYLNLLSLAYNLMKPKSYRSSLPDVDEEVDKEAIFERIYSYVKKILKAGYGIESISMYLNTLKESKRYDELIDVSYFLIKEKTAEELGLPGLAHIDDADNLSNDIIYEEVIDAFFYTNRNEEALLWCKKYHELYPNDWYINRSIGDILCRLNRPEDAARQWIIALQEGGHTDGREFIFDTLCDMIADNNYFNKYILHKRLASLKDEVPDERRAVYNKISLEVYRCIGYPDKRILTETYIEGKLNMKLPPIEEKDYFSLGNLWLPKTMGPHPILPPEVKLSDKKNGSPIITRTPAVKPETIERYGIDLTDQVSSGKYPPVVGRDKEIDSLIQILIRMEKNNPVLLGDAGVGKTAIIVGLAQRINEDKVPEYLKGRRIIELTMSALVGGTMWRGEFEQRITNIIKELRENKDIILFIDELHTIMGAGAANRSDLDVANIAKPALAKGEIRLVGATTSKEYAKYIEKDQAMARRFTPVRVEEMNKEATLQVLKYRVKFWLEKHNIDVPEEVLGFAIDLTEHHLKNRRFPDKAIDLLDESCALMKTQLQTNNENQQKLTPQYVEHVFKEWTGRTTEQISTIEHEQEVDYTGEREVIKAALQKQVIGQKETVSQISASVWRIKYAMKEPSTPSVFVFYGDTGTGKTTMAHALATTLWPVEQDRILTLNMTEYSDRFANHRLWGAPPGYSGFEEEGILTSRIKRNPFSIVVLKNIEEAHKQTINFFSSIFKKGFFVDKTGQEVLAGDIVFILHLNLKTENTKLGFTKTAGNAHTNNEAAMDALKKAGISTALLQTNLQFFKFSKLSKGEAKTIVNNHLDKLKENYVQKGIKLVFEDDMQNQLAQIFFEQPGEKRNMEGLIDQEVIPRIRDKMIQAASQNIKEIKIEFNNK